MLINLIDRKITFESDLVLFHLVVTGIYFVYHLI
jgi:hypothetical protein